MICKAGVAEDEVEQVPARWVLGGPRLLLQRSHVEHEYRQNAEVARLEGDSRRAMHDLRKSS